MHYCGKVWRQQYQTVVPVAGISARVALDTVYMSHPSYDIIKFLIGFELINIHTTEMCPRVQNHYKGLFVALTGQKVPVAQWFSTVACNATVLGSIPVVCILLIFFTRN